MKKQIYFFAIAIILMLLIIIVASNLYLDFLPDIKSDLLCVLNNDKLSKINLSNGQITSIFNNPQYKNISNPSIRNNEIIVCCNDVYDNKNKIIGIYGETQKIKEYYSTNNTIAYPQLLTDNILIFLMKEREEYYLYLLNVHDNSFHRVLSNSVSDVGFSIINNDAILVSIKENDGICSNNSIYVVYPDGNSEYICEGRGAIWVKDANSILYNTDNKVYLLDMDSKEKNLVMNHTMFFSVPVFVDKNIILFIDYDEVGLFSSATLPYCYIMDIENKKKIKLIDYLERNDVQILEEYYNVGILGMCMHTGG